ncbi:MAG: alkaline phosphatase family protein [Promethearchaeota archaeon]
MDWFIVMIIFLFILDGCAVTQFKEANTPFLDKIAEEGKVSLECVAIFPTATYTGHSTIITGNYPEIHGMVGNQFWDRKMKCVRNFDDYDPNKNIETPTIFDLLPFPTCAICEPVTRGASLIVEKKFFDKISLDAQNRSIFEQLKNSVSPNIQFYMVNFQGVDGYGESAGPESKKYLNCLEEVDGFLSVLKNLIHSDFVFMVTADHGMTTVNLNINLEEELRIGGFQARCIASHRCSHIYTNSNLEELEKYLRTLPFIDRVFNSTEIERVHLKHKRTGDLVVCAKKGFEFGNEKLNGSHGGATQDEILVPFIFYDVKGELSDRISLESMSLTDICPTILDLFNIKPKVKFQGKSLYKT